MGPDCSDFATHSADLFMCYENPITFSKIIISVTSEVEKPDKFVVRLSNDTRKITGSCSYGHFVFLRLNTSAPPPTRALQVLHPRQPQAHRLQRQEGATSTIVTAFWLAYSPRRRARGR